MSDMKHITPLPNGYWVRFFRGSQCSSKRTRTECYLHRTFKYLDYGGERGARLAAQAWRDEQLKNHRKRTPRDWKMGTIHARSRVDNSTDTPGVSRRVAWYPSGDYVSYVAHWTVYTEHGEAKTKTKTFGCGNKRTEEEAFTLAKAARAKAVRSKSRIGE